jgi:hypothetical protein
MGKRSNFDRIPRDFYPTPREAVLPLLDHLPADFTYWEPCAGDGALIDAIWQDSRQSIRYCRLATDIEPRAQNILKLDALSADPICADGCDLIITNPPWDRKILHPMIEHFSAMRPTWLLFDADWMHTKQSARFIPWLHKVVSVGRVKWIPDSKMTGKDNCAWYLFDQSAPAVTQFVGRAA